MPAAQSAFHSLSFGTSFKKRPASSHLHPFVTSTSAEAATPARAFPQTIHVEKQKSTRRKRKTNKRLKLALEKVASSSPTKILSRNDEKEDFAEGTVEESSDAEMRGNSSNDSSSESEADDDGPSEIHIYANAAPTSDLTATKKRPRKKNRIKDANRAAQIQREEVSHFRNQNNIHVFGSDICPPMRAFADLATRYGISPVLLENLATAGYSCPTPIQMQAMPLLLEKRDLLASAPTGSGKTAAFLLPVLHLLKSHDKVGYRAVVVSPTRELAKQTLFEVERLSENTTLKSHMIDNTSKLLQKMRKNNSKLGTKFDILVTTPNKLVTLLQSDPKVISLASVEWLIIDEADKLFVGDQEGGFRDQLAIIFSACTNPTVRRALFSATFASEVEEWCKLNLDNVALCSIGARNAATRTIDQKLVFVGSQSGKSQALREIFLEFSPPVLIFVQTKQRAVELYDELKSQKQLKCEVIHSGRSQEERDAVVNDFRAGRIFTLIATEVMGRGVDFVGVNLVINYDFPTTSISYIHRIGRTGRAGRPGRAVTFFTEKDSVYLRSIANVMESSGCSEVPAYMLNLKKPTKSIPKFNKRESANDTPLRKTKKTGVVKKSDSLHLRSKAGVRKIYERMRRLKRKSNEKKS